MISLIFIDANIPVYAAGRAHPMKEPCIGVLRLVARSPAAFVTDAEVLQELLHHYLGVHAWSHGKITFEGFARVMRERVEPVHAGDVELAALLADRYSGLSARDLIHAAVMVRLGTKLIATADRGFDRIEGFRRLDPSDLSNWRSTAET